MTQAQTEIPPDLDSWNHRKDSALPSHRVRVWRFVLAGTLITLLYSIHLIYCQNSTLQHLDVVFTNSDMHTNLLWAKGIREQGWLNAVPYHPYTTWMQPVASYRQWVAWWGGEQIFQQSPLYAYLLALFFHRYLWMRILQALMSIATCVFIGLLAARVSGRSAGWIAFGLAALYAPFFVYSWPFLRDGLGWFISAALLWVLSELTQAVWPSARARMFAWPAGVLLGLGYLGRETFLLLIPVTLAVLACFAWKRAEWGVVPRVVIALLLTISPLIARNWLVGAPLLSTSNRFAETFIQGHARTAHPYKATIPVETGPILHETNGRAWPVMRASIASNAHGVWGWMKLQLLKLLSLFDPYESPDNLSCYFVAHVSPVVRFGLRYWMLLPLALAGLCLSISRCDRTHVWIWLFLPSLLCSVLFGIPLSRYRQSMMVVFIPLAAYSLVIFSGWIRRRDFRAASAYALSVLIGWGLMLGPLAREPRSQYERVQEYVFSAQIFHMLGQAQNEEAMLNLVRQKFPEMLPSDPATIAK